MAGSIGMETPVPIIVASMARGGWGELSGRQWQGVRSVLQAVSARARGKEILKSTVWQIAQSAGLSERWTAKCLQVLEGIGAIRWQRGTIVGGKPEPSIFTIMKYTLLDLCHQAWNHNSEAWGRHRAQTYARLRALKQKLWQKRSSDRSELSADFNPFKGTVTELRNREGTTNFTPTPSTADAPDSPADSPATPQPLMDSLEIDADQPICYTCKRRHRPLKGREQLEHFKTFAPESYQFTLELARKRCGDPNFEY